MGEVKIWISVIIRLIFIVAGLFLMFSVGPYGNLGIWLIIIGIVIIIIFNLPELF